MCSKVNKVKKKQTYTNRYTFRHIHTIMTDTRKRQHNILNLQK